LKVVIHQPQYFPYPGFFNKIQQADVFVVMDDAQYDKRFTNRNRILDPHGPVWLSVPINKAQRFLPNREIEINNSLDWREEHWKRLLISYSNSPHFDLYRNELEAIYSSQWYKLIDLNLATLRKCAEWLGITTNFILESELGVSTKRTERILDVCDSLKADTYVSGPGGHNYLQEDLFAKRGIKLEYQEFRPLPYRQRFAKDFVPNLSIIDLLANLGDDSRDYVKGEARVNLVA
jgi:WbqC-like protein family